jgi:simple sugar transport system permease protein
MAVGLATFLLFLFTGEKGVSTKLHSLSLPVIDIPLIKDIPVLGAILSGHNVLTYLAVVLIAVTSVILKRTKLGIRIRAVGHDPATTMSVGINVYNVKMTAVLMSGLLASFAGAYLSMGYMNLFTSNMVAGRGYIAIAAEAMGGGMPLGSAAASLIFGFFDALANVMQSLRIPSELIQCIPYAATIIGFVLFCLKKKRVSDITIKNKGVQDGKRI